MVTTKWMGTGNGRAVLLALGVALGVALGGCGGGSDDGSGEEDSDVLIVLPDIPPPYVRTSPFRPSLSVAFTSIELGHSHTCGIVVDGRSFCMGLNEYGQLGTLDPMQRCVSGAIPCTPTPLPVSTTARFTSLGLSLNHSCGLTGDGQAWCWGFGAGGQLGDGLRTNSPTPVRVASDVRFRAISHGNAAINTCAVALDGQVHCWGVGLDGLNGDGSEDLQLTPHPIASTVRMQQVGVGQFSACALAQSGEIYCWGRNLYGMLGQGGPGRSLIPALVTGGRQYSALAVGGQHVCALDTTRQAWCWGYAVSVGSAAASASASQGVQAPVAVDGGRRYIAISAAYGHTCALDEGGAAWCWGANGVGTLGDGTTDNRVSPVPVAGNLRFRQISAGDVATCGIVTNGTLACWGSNSYGQLGFTPGDP